MIRENALKLLRDEIPHGIGIGIDKIKLREDGIHDVFATIYCERETHKGIIIGHGGRMLKRIGSEARRDIEWLFGTKVNLQLWVKVRPDWRNSASALKEFGFTPDFKRRTTFGGRAVPICNNRRLFILALPEGTAVPEISFNISRCGKIGPKRFLCFFAAWSPVAFFAKCFGKERFLIVRGAAFCD